MKCLRWVLLALISGFTTVAADPNQFSQQDIALLKTFTLSALGPLPEAPDNRWADDDAAASLGKALFFDPALSRNGNISCASCHQPEKYFTDGLPQSVALGTTRRNSPSIPNALYGPWQFWDGRADSLWSQALKPLEDDNEHGINRIAVAQLIADKYAKEFTEIFGDEQRLADIRALAIDANKTPVVSPDQSAAVNKVFSHVGKAIMAYERKLTLTDSKFDRFVQALETNAGNALAQSTFNETEIAGLRLFMGKGNCASCHNGPLFTNFEFHNIGAPEPDITDVDLGRYAGVETLRSSEFNCLSVYSDAVPEQCDEMNFLKTQGPELVGAFKTPSLRNVSQTAPYMQSGQLATLADVVAHYNSPVPPYYDREQHPSRPHFDIIPLKLTEEEQAQLVSFLETLVSPLPQNNPWWFP